MTLPALPRVLRSSQLCLAISFFLCTLLLAKTIDNFVRIVAPDVTAVPNHEDPNFMTGPFDVVDDPDMRRL